MFLAYRYSMYVYWIYIFLEIHQETKYRSLAIVAGHIEVILHSRL